MRRAGATRSSPNQQREQQQRRADPDHRVEGEVDDVDRRAGRRRVRSPGRCTVAVGVVGRRAATARRGSRARTAARRRCRARRATAATALGGVESPSMAASLAGWFSATAVAIQSPTTSWIGRRDGGEGERDQQPEPVVAVAAAAQHARPRTPTATRKPVTMKAAMQHVHELRPRRRVEHRADRVGVDHPPVRPSGSRWGCSSRRSPRSRRTRPRCRRRSIGTRAQHVRARRHPVPAEEVDADEDRLEEEGEALEREREAVAPRRTGPSGPARGCPSRTTARARHRARPRTARPSPWPSVWARSQEHRVAALVGAPLGEHHDRRERDPEARARMMCQPSDSAICMRAGKRFSAAPASTSAWSTRSAWSGSGRRCSSSRSAEPACST